ncbi:hypothetical protein CVT25_008173 [Psilocybe cyanescens]|uniref:F-box domain-containing protein n=1 Tax=Psilocybe cyanescens TaxID=93625 RepID=A0A409X9P4_PSICY|nr:hypothetical protein CVT25_008173 [Psilocybe cyanescens]
MGANSPSLAMRTKLALILVSKAWRRIALQILYRHLEVRSLVRAHLILKTLQQSVSNQESYGRWTRHVEVFTFTRNTNDIKYLHAIYKILELCPELRIFSGNWTRPLHIDFLNGVARLLGPSLPALYWKDTKLEEAPQRPKFLTATTPDFLGSFQMLRTLDLRHFWGSNPTTWSQLSRPNLPFLKDLVLSMRPESLKVATFLAMPSLQNLTLQTSDWDFESEKLLTSFLNTHGASITAVDLHVSADYESQPRNAIRGRISAHIPVELFLSQDVCPILDTITFPATSPPIAPHVHPTLRRIGLRGGKMEGLYPDKPSDLRDHLMAINLDKYPRLELIQIIGFLVDAHTDTLVRDIFIWWVERFEKEMGVTFLDGEAVLWQYDSDHDKSVPTSLIAHPSTGPINLCE